MNVALFEIEGTEFESKERRSVRLFTARLEPTDESVVDEAVTEVLETRRVPSELLEYYAKDR